MNDKENTSIDTDYDENNCEHEWSVMVDSQWSNERSTEVFCVKCKTHGDKNNLTGEVFFPAT